MSYFLSRVSCIACLRVSTNLHIDQVTLLRSIILDYVRFKFMTTLLDWVILFYRLSALDKFRINQIIYPFVFNLYDCETVCSIARCVHAVGHYYIIALKIYNDIKRKTLAVRLSVRNSIKEWYYLKNSCHVKWMGI